MGKQPVDGWTHSRAGQHPELSPHSCPSKAMCCWAVPAPWGDRGASLSTGERRFKADLQDGKDEATGSSKMVGKHLELFCRRKENAVLSFEQVWFEKRVAHPRDDIRVARLECVCRSQWYTDMRCSQVDVIIYLAIEHTSVVGSRAILGSRAAAVIRIHPLLMHGLRSNVQALQNK